jgi:hypothetical protein
MVNVFSQSQDSIHIQGVSKERIRTTQITFNSFLLGFKASTEMATTDKMFYLSLPGTIAPGVFRIPYSTQSGKQSTDVIVNCVDRDIFFVINLNKKLLSFSGSGENRRWISYKKKQYASI